MIRDHIRIHSLAVLMTSVHLAACGTQPADLVLRNGKIVTVDSVHPEAQAIAVSGDRILALGSDGEIARYIGQSTEVIDLNGRLAIPGFIEGHGHYTSLGQSRVMLDLTAVRNWDEIVTMVAAAVAEAEPGEWILGHGWHQEKWDRTPRPAVEGLPLHHGLSTVSPDNPVFLTHASGHASFANARALDLAGITADTPDPAGGEILHDRSGNPTGALREKAQLPVSEAITRSEANRTPEEKRGQAAHPAVRDGPVPDQRGDGGETTRLSVDRLRQRFLVRAINQAADRWRSGGPWCLVARALRGSDTEHGTGARARGRYHAHC